MDEELVIDNENSNKRIEDEEMDEDDQDALIEEQPPLAIIFTNLTNAIFDNGNEKASFESIFQEIDEIVTFQYYKSFRRAIVNFDTHEHAAEARLKFHKTDYKGEIIKCFFTQPIYIGNREGGPHLKPPKREKQFLISPPASPPVGWEPCEEASPIFNYDLVSAVANLAPDELSEGEAHELHPANEDKPGIIVHICEQEKNGECGENHDKMKIVQTRRPDSPS
ncbi:unnamed protein product, partial [Meganyctiphanes norvegica]